MDNIFILDITQDNSMMSVEQEMNIFHLLSRVVLLKIPGDVVEFGCHIGRTAAIMRRTLDDLNSKKRIYVYDSFQGVPALSKKDKDAVIMKGDLHISQRDLLKTFAGFNLRPPIINKCWFKDMPEDRLPEKICFAHLDGDMYSSIKQSLQKIYPLLSPGAIVVIDDYYDPRKHKHIEAELNSNARNKRAHRGYIIKDLFPGVKKACDEFFKDKKEKVHVLISGDQGHAYFVKE